MPNNCRIPPRVPPVLVAALLMLVSGCGDDSSSPSAPESTPAVVTVTGQALLFRQLSVGGQHTCGVTTDDRAYCWGYDFSGELGDGPNPRPDWKRMCGPWPCSRQPVPVAGGLRFRHVSAGFGHSCGVTLDALVYCWG
jgi:alpha-tubulin suppressor-like RCC1 family protein